MTVEQVQLTSIDPFTGPERIKLEAGGSARVQIKWSATNRRIGSIIFAFPNDKELSQTSLRRILRRDVFVSYDRRCNFHPPPVDSLVFHLSSRLRKVPESIRFRQRHRNTSVCLQPKLQRLYRRWHFSCCDQLIGPRRSIGRLLLRLLSLPRRLQLPSSEIVGCKWCRLEAAPLAESTKNVDDCWMSGSWCPVAWPGTERADKTTRPPRGWPTAAMLNTIHPWNSISSACFISKQTVKISFLNNSLAYM